MRSIPNTVMSGNQALWPLGIQHRDITPSNMMYKRIHGTNQGYLIDLDLASLVDHDSQNLDRTGTIPFMALELLNSVALGQARPYGMVQQYCEPQVRVTSSRMFHSWSNSATCRKAGFQKRRYIPDTIREKAGNSKDIINILQQNQSTIRLHTFVSD